MIDPSLSWHAVEYDDINNDYVQDDINNNWKYHDIIKNLISC